MRQVLYQIPGTPIKIFGFGVMLCLAFFAAIGLAGRRARKNGIAPEVVYDLALWFLVGGIVGARALYVWEYWGDGVGSFTEIFKIWEGGIVFYGGMIGATVGSLAFWAIKKFPLRPMMDVVAPPVALGLALGRLGCFLNGCCYGDQCELPWAVAFPPGSPPWWEAALDPSGAPAPGYHADLLEAVRRHETPPGTPWSPRVHPTQIYSTIDALILLGLMLAYDPLRRRSGVLLAIFLTTYPITRALIEQLRGDEPAFFAGMTISQNVSLATFFVGLGLWAYLLSRPPDLAGPLADSVQPTP